MAELHTIRAGQAAHGETYAEKTHSYRLQRLEDNINLCLEVAENAGHLPRGTTPQAVYERSRALLVAATAGEPLPPLPEGWHVLAEPLSAAVWYAELASGILTAPVRDAATLQALELALLRAEEKEALCRGALGALSALPAPEAEAPLPLRTAEAIQARKEKAEANRTAIETALLPLLQAGEKTAKECAYALEQAGLGAFSTLYSKQVVREAARELGFMFGHNTGARPMTSS